MENIKAPENTNLGSWRELLGYLVAMMSVTVIGFFFSEKNPDLSNLISKASMGVNVAIAIYYYLILRRRNPTLAEIDIQSRSLPGYRPLYLILPFLLFAVGTILPLIIGVVWQNTTYTPVPYVPMKNIPIAQNAADAHADKILRQVDVSMLAQNVPAQSHLTLKILFIGLLNGQLPPIDTFSDAVIVTLIMLVIFVGAPFLIVPIRKFIISIFTSADVH